jgi:hypothetical protein
VPLLTMQNATNITIERHRYPPLSSTPAAPGAANTSTFLAHCFGRASTKAALGRLRLTTRSPLARR